MFRAELTHRPEHELKGMETDQRGTDLRCISPLVFAPFPEGLLRAQVPLISVLAWSSPGKCCRDVFSEVDSHAPCPVHISVYPQFDKMPDHGLPIRQQTDVGYKQDRATPVPAAVITLYF